MHTHDAIRSMEFVNKLVFLHIYLSRKRYSNPTSFFKKVHAYTLIHNQYLFRILVHGLLLLRCMPLDWLCLHLNFSILILYSAYPSLGINKIFICCAPLTQYFNQHENIILITKVSVLKLLMRHKVVWANNWLLIQ